MMEKIQSQTEEYFASMADPEAMFNKFMPMGLQAMEHYKTFYNNIANTAYGNKTTEND